MIGKTISHYKIIEIWKDADEDLPGLQNGKMRLVRLMGSKLMRV